jgi:serine/threonine-protein kinase
MAPELHTAGTAGVESDVYSLGCLLWAAVTGTAPYPGTSDYQIATSHFMEPIPQLAGDTAAILETNRILRAAMAKQPGDRDATAAARRDDLRRAQSLAASTELLAADPAASSAGDSGGPGPRRRRLAALVAALAVLVVVGGAAAAIALKDRNDDPETDPGPNPTTNQSGSTTPPSPDSSITPVDGDRAKAVSSLSQALQITGGLTEAQADCTADQWVEEAGLKAMIEDGFFDEDMVYHDKDQSEMSPEMKNAALTATLACAGAT